MALLLLLICLKSESDLGHSRIYKGGIIIEALLRKETLQYTIPRGIIEKRENIYVKKNKQGKSLDKEIKVISIYPDHDEKHNDKIVKEIQDILASELRNQIKNGMHTYLARKD